MKYPKAIFFDLDDTILEYEGVADEAWRLTFDDFIKLSNAPLSPNDLFMTFATCRSHYWSDLAGVESDRQKGLNTRHVVLAQALKHYNIVDTAYVKQLAGLYTHHRMRIIRLFPDSLNVLTTLSESDITLILITNGKTKMQREKINRFALERFFTLILVEEEVGYGKPDLRVYRLALESAGCDADESWMIGDNLLWDVEAPKSLGIYSIWCNRYHSSKPASAICPDACIENLMELLDILAIAKAEVNE